MLPTTNPAMNSDTLAELVANIVGPAEPTRSLAEVRGEVHHEVVVRARELIGILLLGETQFTEDELDALVALKDSLDAIPQPILV